MLDEKGLTAEVSNRLSRLPRAAFVSALACQALNKGALGIIDLADYVFKGP